MAFGNPAGQHDQSRCEGGDGPGGGDGALVDWLEGDEGTVVDVAGGCRMAVRLREVGVVAGARVRVLRTGCPTVIQVEEGRFCIRRRDAASIRVRPGQFTETREKVPRQSADTEPRCSEGRHRGRGRRWRHRDRG